MEKYERKIVDREDSKLESVRPEIGNGTVAYIVGHVFFFLVSLQ